MKYANKERSQIVVVGVDRGNNGAVGASGFVNLLPCLTAKTLLMSFYVILTVDTTVSSSILNLNRTMRFLF